ncbi:LemA family protein [Sphingomonas sp. BGYR3]|uniref:LemA family protein n=1 Tax=Sphingomonas sp. BGYR3 TaxID=2975483 RepID=UPI0021A32770|nr:LemA family protein [Sphingomonas sp. BGYR3]MDG5489404.1 LemA family protein [Sphingomonas sp. BGYR3]
MRFKAVIALTAAAMLSACGLNSVPTAEENAKARWADVESEYQRRADLIPNLVNTVKGFAAQEERVLTEVTQARARATGVNVSADDLTDPAKLEQFEAAQGALSASLGRLLVVSENYPTLTSNENFRALQNELATTENQINIARRDYNSAVQSYNTTIRTFPDAIGAKVIYGSKPMATFKATTPGADTAPKVNFEAK